MVKGFPDKLILSEEFDRVSVTLLKNYSGNVVILGQKLPSWFQVAYEGNNWRTLSFPEMKEISSDVATIWHLKVEESKLIRCKAYLCPNISEDG